MLQLESGDASCVQCPPIAKQCLPDYLKMFPGNPPMGNVGILRKVSIPETRYTRTPHDSLILVCFLFDIHTERHAYRPEIVPVTWFFYINSPRAGWMCSSLDSAFCVLEFGVQAKGFSCRG